MWNKIIEKRKKQVLLLKYNLKRTQIAKITLKRQLLKISIKIKKL